MKLGLAVAACVCIAPQGSGGLDLTLGEAGRHVEASLYKSPALSENPNLVIVLHGDAPLLRPAYQDDFAADVARRGTDVVAVGLLRPGYADPFGRRSDPQTGPDLGNNYTVRVDDQMAAAIRALQKRYHPRRTLLVGHSGGAAVVANLLENEPRIADGAVIASCPCDLPAWQAKMASFGRPGSHKDSLSPIAHVDRLPRSIPIHIMVGAQDKTVGVDNSRRFYDAAKAAGARVSLTVVPGAGHMMMGSPEALDTVEAMLAAPRR